jgi:hypothetical protein
VVGEVVDGLAAPPARPEVVSLVERFGVDRARTDTVACIEEVAAEVLAACRR